MKKLIVIAALFAQVNLSAQSKMLSGYIRLGVTTVHDTKIGLQKMTGINEFGTDFYGAGAELLYKTGKWILDSEIMLHSHGPKNNNERFAEPFIATLVGKAGFALIDEKNLFVYPSAGIGCASFLVSTYNKLNNRKSNLHTVYLFQPVAVVALNADVIIYRFNNTPSTGILPVGIRTGYRFSRNSTKWKGLSGSDLEPEPFSSRSWFFSVALGMGYITTKK